jgi:hypothetical protein
MDVNAGFLRETGTPPPELFPFGVEKDETAVNPYPF